MRKSFQGCWRYEYTQLHWKLVYHNLMSFYKLILLSNVIKAYFHEINERLLPMAILFGKVFIYLFPKSVNPFFWMVTSIGNIVDEQKKDLDKVKYNLTYKKKI